MSIEFEISDEIPASSEVIYDAWLNSEEHSRMTGGLAKVSPKRILQLWRTTEFIDTEKDSRLEILLDPVNGGTRITIRHSALPEHGMQYRQGWIDAYFLPMKAYFGGKM